MSATRRSDARLANARAEAASEGWGPPFGEAEYADRVRRVIARMRGDGIDTLVVTSPANITYLSGYDMVWYYPRTPTAVVVRADEACTLFFDLEYHRPTVEYHAVVDDVECFESFHGAATQVVDALHRRGWAGGRIGFETWSRNPNANVLSEIQAGIGVNGGECVDASWLVDDVRLIKSAAERDVMREAGRIADVAFESVAEAVRPGMTEIELAGVALAAMMREGGGDPAIRVAVRSGPRFLARHSAPSHRRFQPGELVWVNFCGVYHRYHSDLGRLLSLGTPDERWGQLIESASAITDEVMDGAFPGMSTQRLHDAAEQAADEAGIAGQAVLIGGYDLGIAIPPDWVGHTFTRAARGVVEASYDIGMVTNFEMLFRAGPGWHGGAGGGFIDTVVMTADGIDVLSRLPRSIVVK